VKHLHIRREFLDQFDALYTPLKLVETVIAQNDSDEGGVVVRLAMGERVLRLHCCEVNRGTPQLIRHTVLRSKQQLRLVTTNEVLGDVNGADEMEYVAVIAPYLSSDALKVCAELGVSCFDLAGNMRVSCGDVYVERTGQARQHTDSQRPRPFTGKAERVMRVMLMADPSQPQKWTVRGLAAQAEVSLGRVSQALQPLAEQEWVTVGRGKEGIRMQAAGRILDAWRVAYVPSVLEAYQYVSIEDPERIEQQLVKYCEGAKLQYCFSTFSGAARLMAMGGYDEVTMYVQADRSQLRDMATQLKLKSSSGPGSVVLNVPEDNRFFYGVRKMRRVWVAHAVQVYLDLWTHPQRGREAAGMLRESVIGF